MTFRRLEAAPGSFGQPKAEHVPWGDPLSAQKILGRPFVRPKDPGAASGRLEVAFSQWKMCLINLLCNATATHRSNLGHPEYYPRIPPTLYISLPGIPHSWGQLLCMTN